MSRNWIDMKDAYGKPISVPEDSILLVEPPRLDECASRVCISYAGGDQANSRNVLWREVTTPHKDIMAQVEERDMVGHINETDSFDEDGEQLNGCIDPPETGDPTEADELKAEEGVRLDTDEITQAAREEVFELFCEERQRQIEDKGYDRRHDRDHSKGEWCGILMHELGGLADVSLNCFGYEAFNRQIVKIGAVCMAYLESGLRERIEFTQTLTHAFKTLRKYSSSDNNNGGEQ